MNAFLTVSAINANDPAMAAVAAGVAEVGLCRELLPILLPRKVGLATLRCMSANRTHLCPLGP